MRKTCAAVIVAAGSAQRMQGIDKMLAPLCGEPVLLRTVKALGRSECIDRIYIVTREDLVQQVETLCIQEPKLAGVVRGGNSRAESVLRGLEEAREELVAIHDGARPLVTPQVIEAAVSAAQEMGAAAPAIAVHDTIKVAKNAMVVSTPERSTLFAVQTPQVFDRLAIIAALRSAMAQNVPLTDDCSAAEFAGMPVRLTAGSEENLKITVPADLISAETILKRRESL